MNTCLDLATDFRQNKLADTKHPVVNTSMILHCKHKFIDLYAREEC